MRSTSPATLRFLPHTWYAVATLLTVLIAHFFPARAELIYDNSFNDQSLFLTRSEEFGDEIIFAGTARTLFQMEFEVFGEPLISFAARARIRLYSNNGPTLPAPAPTVAQPGDLLFQSAELPIRAGVQPIRLTNLNLNLPERVTWTIEFLGTGTEVGRRAGLRIYHPPVVGRSFRDYWVRTSSGWGLFLPDGGVAGSFGSRFIALPDPPVSFTVSSAPDGSPSLRITGPIGSEQLVEASHDNVLWRPVAVADLTRTNATTVLDAFAPLAGLLQYRTREVPVPGATVVVQGNRADATGKRTVHLSGSIRSNHFLEASEDLLHWRLVDVVHFATSTLAVPDPLAGPNPVFYRTRRPTADQPLGYIRSATRQPDGSIVLSLHGSPSATDVALEVTDDWSTWTQLNTLRFTTPERTYTDASAASSPFRIYRLRWP